MSKKRRMNDISEEQQKQYERRARLQYDPQTVNDSIKRWNSYTQDQQEAIKEEGQEIYSAMADALEAGTPANSGEVQLILARWHEHIRYFYEPSLDTLRGLGELYNTSPDFMANFQKLHQDLPAYLQDAIAVYVDDLETAEIERMLAADEERLSNVTNNLEALHHHQFSVLIILHKRNPHQP